MSRGFRDVGPFRLIHLWIKSNFSFNSSFSQANKPFRLRKSEEREEPHFSQRKREK
jgi:hypothetical protein